jgi:hypothetical protein
MLRSGLISRSVSADSNEDKNLTRESEIQVIVKHPVRVSVCPIDSFATTGPQITLDTFSCLKLQEECFSHHRNNLLNTQIDVPFHSDHTSQSNHLYWREHSSVNDLASSRPSRTGLMNQDSEESIPLSIEIVNSKSSIWISRIQNAEQDTSVTKGNVSVEESVAHHANWAPSTNALTLSCGAIPVTSALRMRRTWFD